jgi:hypothetical protein
VNKAGNGEKIAKCVGELSLFHKKKRRGKQTDIAIT